jgi:pentatricopeptide repeat protein
MSKESVICLVRNPEEALSVLNRLAESGCEPWTIGLLMTDRTAARSFSPPGPRPTDCPSSGEEFAVEKTRELHTLAALGTPGSGVVGAGPVTTKLARAGLGSTMGFPGALAKLGLSREEAASVASALVHGAIHVTAEVGDATAFDTPPREAFGHAHGGIWTISGDDRPIPGGAAILPPDAPATEQRAQYEPVLAPPTKDEVLPFPGGRRGGVA